RPRDAQGPFTAGAGEVEKALRAGRRDEIGHTLLPGCPEQPLVRAGVVPQNPPILPLPNRAVQRRVLEIQRPGGLQGLTWPSARLQFSGESSPPPGGRPCAPPPACLQRRARAPSAPDCAPPGPGLTPLQPSCASRALLLRPVLHTKGENGYSQDL